MLDITIGAASCRNHHGMKNLLLPTLLFFLNALLSACSPMGGSIQSNQPNAVVNSTPHAQTLEEGEALENKMAKEAEEKAKQDQDPANQVRAEQEKIESQIREQQEKAEGNN
jgi:hypothetical protein